MHTGITIKPPLFELGLKGYVWGDAAVELAQVGDRLMQQYGVTILFTPQLVDVALIASNTHRVLVLAPHLDPVRPGKGSGAALPEAVKATGAAGALLNHSEKPVTLNHIETTIRRADEVGLISVVCADSAEQAAGIALLRPNIILAEPPDLIGSTTGAVAGQGDFIAESVAKVRAIDERIMVINSAGIRNGDDAAAVIRAGAHGTGSTSGVLTADDPAAMFEQMVQAVREAWDA
jgi:triosephosphate isomerase